MSCFVQTYIPTTIKLEDNILQTAGAWILNALSMYKSVTGNDWNKCNFEPHDTLHSYSKSSVRYCSTIYKNCIHSDHTSYIWQNYLNVDV